MKIAWSINIPVGAKLKVKEGESVEVGDVIYELHENIVDRLPLIGWQNLNSSGRKKILQEIIKKDLITGQIIGQTGWFLKNILKSPGAGKCLGVDEFGNIELESEKDEKYLAPISANKIRMDDGKIIFELKGFEFEGEGITQFKVWGDFDGLVVDDMNQIDSLQSKQIVIIKDNNIDAAIKAEAVGVVGMILVGFEKTRDLVDSDIPIILIKDDDLEKIIKLVDGRKSKIWLNATVGKVLVVLE